MSESLDEIDRILNQKTWLERIEQFLMVLLVIGMVYWGIHFLIWAWDGFGVGL